MPDIDKASTSKLEDMQEMLSDAAETIVALQTQIDAMAAAPYTSGIVLALPERDILLGSKVQLRVKTPSYRDNVILRGKTGTVVELDDTSVMVRFEQRRLWFPIVDLKPAENPDERLLTVLMKGSVMQLGCPTKLNPKVGDTLVLTENPLTGISVVGIGTPINFGEASYVSKVIDSERAEITTAGDQTNVVLMGRFADDIKVGDKVAVHAHTLIVEHFGQDETHFAFEATTGVTWDSIGGLHEAKDALREAIELPFTHPDFYRFYSKRPTKGVLLSGPAGCGKTMLGKAAATALSALHGSTRGSFNYIKGPEILNQYVGASEAAVRRIFAEARRFKAENGFPAVVFIDEADAILSKRGSGISSDINNTIVPMFLAEMDGLDDAACFMLLATNRPDQLDPAVVRDGRIDRKIVVTRPNLPSTKEIANLALKDVPLANGLEQDTMAHLIATELFNGERTLYRIRTKQGVRTLALCHVLNGAMVVNAVDRATSLAMRRDIRVGTPSGVGKADVLEAINIVHKENLHLDHTEALADFVAPFKSDVLDIQREAN